VILLARYGPVTTDTSTVALGLAQIRVGNSPAYIAHTEPVLSSTHSMGAMASTKFTGTTDWWKLESGFPLEEDLTIATREGAQLECVFKEIKPLNLAYAYGIATSTSGEYSSAHSGEIALGGRTSPDYIRMEAYYTFHNGTNTMTIIFPRAQMISTVEIDLQAEDAAGVPVTFESKNASSDSTGGDSCWDSKPLGRIYFQ